MINLKIGLGGHRGRRGRRKISEAGPEFGIIPKGSQSISYLSFQSVKLLSRHKMFILVTLRTLTYFSKEQRWSKLVMNNNQPMYFYLRHDTDDTLDW